MYINFTPDAVNQAREIAIDDHAAYGMAADLGDLLDSMLKGCTASFGLDGIKDALEDGALLGAIGAEYGIDDAALQELAEELHAALSAARHIGKEQDWQNETTRYWFSVGGSEYAVAESGPDSTILGEDGDDIYDRALQARLRSLLIVTDEMRAE